VLLLKADVLPAQNVVVPVIGFGNALTDNVAVAVHPPPVVYVIVVLPVAIAVAMPVVASIVAIAVRLLLHSPPLTALLKFVVDPTHALSVPVIALGSALTVASTVVLAVPQPFVTL
jgi:hypothetical protein